jgi:hypothetical protein
MCARLSEPSSISTKPTANLKDLQTSRAFEVCGKRNVPLLGIPVLLNQFVKPLRTWLSIGELRPTRIRLPKGPHSLFQFSICV